MAKETESPDITARAVRDMNLASSHTVPQHLEPLRQTALLETAESIPEIVVVPIPDVSTLRSTESSQRDRESQPTGGSAAQRSIRADLSSEGMPTKPLAGSSIDASIHSKPATTPTSIGGPTTAKSNLAVNPPGVAAAAEKASELTVVDAWWFSVADLAMDRPVIEIARRIVAQFPSIAPASLLFTSADHELSTNRATARIAACVARLTGCKVLIVDANWDANRVAAQVQGKTTLGFSEVLAENRDWSNMVLATGEPNLSVLPCGVADVPQRRIGNDSLMSLQTQWQREYTYVFVNAGHAQQSITRHLAVCCDGTYILVGLNRTTRRDAQSAMKVLVQNHARVLGAIVFDSLPQA